MHKVMRLLTNLAAVATLLCGPVTLAQPEAVPAKEKDAAVNIDAAEDAGARKAQATAALDACDTECVQRRREEKLRARVEEEMTRVPNGTCTATYFDMNATSRRLAEEAVEECRRNYVMQKIDPSYVAQTEARERSAEYNHELTKRAETAVKALSLLWLARQR